MASLAVGDGGDSGGSGTGGDSGGSETGGDSGGSGTGDAGGSSGMGGATAVSVVYTNAEGVYVATEGAASAVNVYASQPNSGSYRFVAAQGERLIFAEITADNTLLRSARLDGAATAAFATPPIVVDDDHAWERAALLPNRVVYALGTEKNADAVWHRSDFYSLRADGSAPELIASGVRPWPVAVVNQQLIFVRDTPQGAELVKFTASSLEPVLLASSKTMVTSLLALPEASTDALVAILTDDAGTDIFKVRADGSGAERLARPGAWRPLLSGSERLVGVVADRVLYEGHGEIYSLSLADLEVVSIYLAYKPPLTLQTFGARLVVTDNWEQHQDGGISVSAVQPDGTQRMPLGSSGRGYGFVFDGGDSDYAIFTEITYNEGDAVGVAQRYCLRWDGTRKSTLGSRRANTFSGFYAVRHGRAIFMDQAPTRSDVFSSSSGGTNLVNLTNTPDYNEHAVADVRGDVIFVRGKRDLPANAADLWLEIYAVSLHGGDVRQLAGGSASKNVIGAF